MRNLAAQYVALLLTRSMPSTSVQVQPMSGNTRASTASSQIMAPHLGQSLDGTSGTSKYVVADSLYGDYIPGGIRIQIPDPYKNVTRITLRESFVPRVDNLLYVLLGVRFFPSKEQPDKVQIGQSPSAASVQSTLNSSRNAYSIVKVTPHAPVFAQIGLAQADSTASLQLSQTGTDIKYSYITEVKYSHDFRPPVRTVETMEVVLYKPPTADATYDLQPYDILVYKVTLDRDVAALNLQSGQTITTRTSANLETSDHDFTAIVLQAAASSLLLSSFGSLATFTNFVARTGIEGVLDSEKTLYLADTNSTVLGIVSSPTQVTELTTRSVINFEIECDV